MTEIGDDDFEETGRSGGARSSTGSSRLTRGRAASMGAVSIDLVARNGIEESEGEDDDTRNSSKRKRPFVQPGPSATAKAQKSSNPVELSEIPPLQLYHKRKGKNADFLNSLNPNGDGDGDDECDEDGDARQAGPRAVVDGAIRERDSESTQPTEQKTYGRRSNRAVSKNTYAAGEDREREVGGEEADEDEEGQSGAAWESAQPRQQARAREGPGGRPDDLQGLTAAGEEEEAEDQIWNPKKANSSLVLTIDDDDDGASAPASASASARDSPEILDEEDAFAEAVAAQEILLGAEAKQVVAEREEAYKDPPGMNRPCILFLDSLGLHDPRAISRNLYR